MVISTTHRSETIKGGFATEKGPSTVYPTLISRRRPTTMCILPGISQVDRYIGEEAQTYHFRFDQRYPVDDGIVTDFSDIEWIWDYLYEEKLKAKPEDHPVLFTEPNVNSKENRERVTTLLFEQFSVPALCLSMQGVLAIHCSGKSTGVVLDSGTASTYAIPVYEGFALRRGIQRLHVGGQHLTEHFVKTLDRSGYNFETSFERNLVRKVKEEYCYVAQDFRKELRSAQGPLTETNYKLADGKAITVGKERFLIPETLFHPHLMGLNNEMGIQHLTFGSVLKSDTSLHDTLYGNIVLSGGSTMFPGIRDRMQSEMAGLAPSSVQVNVVALPERKHSAWIGGAMIASLSTFQKMCILYEEYDEIGPTLMHRRCF